MRERNSFSQSASQRLLALLALQLVERDRQVPHACTGRVVDRVCYGRRNPDDADLTETLDAQRLDDLIRFVDEDHLDAVHVRIYGHMILGEDRKSTRLNSSHLVI